MRVVASAVIAAALLPVLTAGASRGDLGDTIAIRMVTLAGQKHMLSVHDWPSHYTLSPDLTRFAYAPVSRDGVPTNELRTTNVRRLRERVLVEAPTPIADVAWAPNGSTIALSLYDSIWLVRSDGAGLHRIGNFGGSLAWSPDSRELAVHHPVGGIPGTISVLTVDTGAVRNVATGSDRCGRRTAPRCCLQAPMSHGATCLQSKSFLRPAGKRVPSAADWQDPGRPVASASRSLDHSATNRPRSGSFGRAEGSRSFWLIGPTSASGRRTGDGSSS